MSQVLTILQKNRKGKKAERGQNLDKKKKRGLIIILHCTDTGSVEGCKEKNTKDRGKTQKC